MTDLKPIIAKNITELRRGAGMTQIELAGKLNYSDKAVSKWEHGDSTPDINILRDGLADRNDRLRDPAHHRSRSLPELDGVRLRRSGYLHRLSRVQFDLGQPFQQLLYYLLNL